MVQKKLSAVDRLTLATGVVEKINDKLKKERQLIATEIEKSLGLHPDYEDNLKTISKYARSLRQLELDSAKIIAEISTIKDNWKKLIKHEGYAWSIKFSEEEGKQDLKNLYINEQLREKNISDPLDEYKVKSLINKGQSLALLAEDQDPQSVDKMLMEELSKQI